MTCTATFPLCLERVKTAVVPFTESEKRSLLDEGVCSGFRRGSLDWCAVLQLVLVVSYFFVAEIMPVLQ
jgi:hypothetical protein